MTLLLIWLSKKVLEFCDATFIMLFFEWSNISIPILNYRPVTYFGDYSGSKFILRVGIDTSSFKSLLGIFSLGDYLYNGALEV